MTSTPEHRQEVDGHDHLSADLFPLRIFLVALALRLLPVLLTPNLGIGLDDMFQYDMIARSLATGNGFRWYAPPDVQAIAPLLNLDVSTLHLDPRGVLTTFRAPLYPGFVALIYLIFGTGTRRFFAVRAAQAIVGAVSAPLTYALAHRFLEPTPVGAGSSAGWISRTAASVVAAYPTFILLPLALATENLFIPLVLASVLALSELGSRHADQQASAAMSRTSISLAAMSGILLGLAALTRSVILPFAALALGWVWISLRARRETLVAGIALVSVIVPWVVRNSIVSGRITGIETSMGYNLYVGYHPQSTGTFTFGPSLDLLSILDDSQRDKVGTARALEFIREDPGRVPYLALRRLGYFFDTELRAFTYFYANDLLGPLPPWLLALVLLLLGAPFAVVSLSAVRGMYALPVKNTNVLLGLLFGGYLLPHVLILSEERFHLAMAPYLAILAAAGWSALRLRLPISRRKTLVGALLCLLLLINWGSQLAISWPTLARMLSPGGNQLYLPY